MRNNDVGFETKDFSVWSPDRKRWVIEPKWLEPNEAYKWQCENNTDDFRTLAQCRKWIKEYNKNKVEVLV